MAQVERNNLVSMSVPVKPYEAVEFTAALVGNSTLDPDRDRKAAILAISWTDEKGAELSGDQLGMSRSDKFGTFTYVSSSFESSSDFKIVLVAPESAARLALTLIRFSNFSLGLTGSCIRRVRA